MNDWIINEYKAEERGRLNSWIGRRFLFSLSLSGNVGFFVTFAFVAIVPHHITSHHIVPHHTLPHPYRTISISCCNRLFTLVEGNIWEDF